MAERITRREFIAGSAAAAAGLALGPAVSARGLLKRNSRPNILVIMTDQQSAGMMSCAGNQWLKTPAMDRLAASGVRFERVYATNPVCVPSRFSLQTGLMPSRIGVGSNTDRARPGATEAAIDYSLGNVFASAGYETVYGGKVHLPGSMDDLGRLGYRRLTGDARQALAESCAEFIKGKHTRPFLLFASFINPHDICYMAINDCRRALGQEPMTNIDSRTCEATLDIARKAGDIKAFVERHAPHLPSNFAIPELEPECIAAKYAPPGVFRGYVREKWTEDQWRLHRWAYCRLTEMVDGSIGRTLDALREAGLQDNTLIVFTSDHGDMDSGHKLEHKQVLYEECMRIPLVVSCRGVVPKGQVDRRHLVSNGMDLLPTLCDYAGIEPPAGLPGASLRPLLDGKADEDWRDHVVIESQNGRAVRTERFKYCVYDSGRHPEQLTDLRNDPGEMTNLAEDVRYRAILDRHRRLLRDWVERMYDGIGAGYIPNA